MFESSMVVERADREGPQQALQDRGATVMGAVNVATAALTTVIAEALAAELWVCAGINSPEQWTRWRFGLSVRRAQRLVAMARRRAELPAITKVFDAGLLSEDQAALLYQRVPAAYDTELAELAPLCLVSQLRRQVATLPPLPEPEPPPDAQREPAQSDGKRRCVRFGFDDGGDWWAHLVLPPDEGARVEHWLRTAFDQLLADRRRRGEAAAESAARWPATPVVSWTDALLHAVDVGLGGLAAGRWGSLRDQVLYHLDLATLAMRVHTGPGLPDRLRRLLTCDSNLRVVLESGGTPVAMSSQAATVNQKLRVLIEDRDGGCRVPWCDRTRGLHIHHIVHHEHGGPTAVGNLCALCPAHHRQHHLGQLGIDGDPTDPDGLIFTDSTGRPYTPGLPRPPDQPPAAPPYANPIGDHLDLRWIAWN